MNHYPLGISVVICCYNSSSRLPETLKHLADQKFHLASLSWEIIVIDNASTDDTSFVAVQEWRNSKSNIPLYVFSQPIPGTGAARDLDIQKAQYELILFCDDDNWLAEGYIELAFNTMSSNTYIGALGGQAFAVCEVEPPHWFDSLKAAYAVGGQGPKANGEISKDRGFIYTAGGVFRKSILDDLKQKGFEKVLTGRTGKNLTPGEDVELCYALILSGQKIYYDERLRFQHFLPKGRLTWSYYKRMSEGFGNTFPFLMPYKLLINKQRSRFDYGIIWLYFTGVYLLFKSIFLELPFSFFNKKYHRVRSNIASHVGFCVSLVRNHHKVKKLYVDLREANWISDEYKF